MNIVAFIISVFSALISFVQGGCGTLFSGAGLRLSQLAGDSARGKQAALLGGGGLLIMFAAVTAIVGGCLAFFRKKNARIVLGVSSGLCILAGTMGFRDGFTWGILYAIATVCAHVDMQKQEKSKTDGSDTANAVMPGSAEEKTVTSEPTANAETIVHIRKRTVAHEPIVGVETAALVKRAFLFLEDGGFDEADRYIEQALNQDPENSKAYIGRLMVNLSVKQEEELQNQSVPLTGQSEYAKALRFADEGYKSVLVGYNQRILDKTGKEAEQKSRKNEEERINAENLRVKTEEENKSKIYDEAVSSKNESTKSGDFREIAEKFRSLGSFKDSEALALECDELADKAQVVEEKHKSKNQKTIAILVGLVLIAFTGWNIYDQANKEKTATATAKLFEASRNGTAQQVEAAIKDGADVKAEDENGNTPLVYATQNAKIRGTEAYKMLGGNPARRYMVSTGDNVRVREAPNIKANSSSEISTIKKGEVVLVVEEKQNPGEDYPWRRIVYEDYGGEENDLGWVYGQFLRETIGKTNVDMGLDTLNGIAWGTPHSQIKGIPIPLAPAEKQPWIECAFESSIEGDYREKGIYLPNARIIYLFDINKCLIGAIVNYDVKENDKNFPKVYSSLAEKLGETQDIERGPSSETLNYEFDDFKVSFGWYDVGFYYSVIKKK